MQTKIVRFLISLAIGIVCTFLGIMLAGRTKAGILGGLSFGIVTTILSYFATIEDQRVRELAHIRDKIDCLEARTEKLIEHFALCGGSFNDTLAMMRRLDESAKWLVARFISKKMSFECPQTGVIKMYDVSLPEFANIHGEIIKECCISAYWTCPYTPTQFFELMFNDDKETLQQIREGTATAGAIRDKLEYLRHFLSHEVDSKKRLVNLHGNQYRKILNDNLLPLFLEVNALDSNLRFVNVNMLELSRHAKKSGDFSIYDNQVVIEWKKKSGKVVNGEVTLTIGPSREYYKELFEDTHWRNYQTAEQIRSLVEEANKE